jgi:hypothetical protein
MRKLVVWMLLFVGIVLGAAACASSGSSSTSAAPPATNVTGTWSGTYVFEPSSAGNGLATLVLSQDGSNVKGNLAVQGPHRFAPATINGVMSGNDIRVTGPDLTGWMKVNGNQMTGLINGVLPVRVTLTKQQ